MMICSINKNLISLKLIIFFYLSGVGCLFAFLSVHLTAVGLSIEDACIISIVAPFVAVLGPFIVGPLADKLSVGKGCDVSSSSGNDANNPGSKILRFMLAVCLIFAALFYGLLLSVPVIKVHHPCRPSVSFMCDGESGLVFQEMCVEDGMCNQWEGVKTGKLHLSNCVYACKKLPQVQPLYSELSSTTEKPIDDDDDSSDDGDEHVADPEVDTNDYTGNRDRRDTNPATAYDSIFPHVCFSQEDGFTPLCQAYSSNSKRITLNASLSTTNGNESDNETTWCKYPLMGNFQCVVPQGFIKDLEVPDDNKTCEPVISCDIDNPYNSEDSILAVTTSDTYSTDPSTVFWTYLVYRSLGDVFATAALCLICTACVIATRETSVGRGDVGGQIAFGIIGMALTPPLITLIHNEVDKSIQIPFFMPIITAVCCFVLAAIIILLDRQMPLTPPEWWWHTKSGLLALPMNTIRRYGIEIVAIVFVMLLLGIFWSALDIYLGWTVKALNGSNIILSLTVTVGLIPAIPILWKAEKFIDYVGHNNIFIGAFTFYIIRYTGMSLTNKAEWILICEIFEVFTLSLVWVTAILYFRHLIPRKYTASGQALPILAHFCIGRVFGALIGSVVRDGDMMEQLRFTYKIMAISACVIGVLYLVLYYTVLLPLYGASVTGPPNSLMMQGLNTNGASNGNYTPLRVYHNERGKKGQFRY